MPKTSLGIYEYGTPWYYALNVIIILYGLGYIASLVLLQNAYVPHTFTPGTTYGTLHTGRFTSGYWLALLFCGMRVFIPLVVCNMLLYRDTRCGRSPGSGCIVFWLVCLVLLILFDLMGFTLLAGYYNKCNGIGSVDNPCNDKRWCCVPDVFMDPGNLCHNTVSCTPLVFLPDLRPDTDFLWLFWTSFVFILADVFFLVVPISLWFQTWTQLGKAAVHEDFVLNDYDEAEDVNDDGTLAGGVPITSSMIGAPSAQQVRRRRLKQ